MPKKKNDYFGEREERAVVDLINAKTWAEKSRIYKKYLEKPFRIMKESILRRWPIHMGSYEMDEVENDAESHLIENINRFNPDLITKSGKKTKAYSYCQTIIRNYYRDHSKKTHKDKKVNLPYHDYSDDIENHNDLKYEIENDKNSEKIPELIQCVIDEMKETIDRGGLTKNELIVGEAVINIFQNWDVLFMENTPQGKYEKNVTNKFQKNKVLLYLKEYTRLSTKEIRDALNIYKTLYFVIKEDFLSEDD